MTPKRAFFSFLRHFSLWQYDDV